MKIDLNGKTALVTGSTAGIGLAIVKGLAATGAEVILNGRKEATVARALTEVRDSVADANVTGFVGDLGNAEGCEALVAAHPSVDILVNNLGIYGPQDFFETPDSDWNRFFETNVMSGVRLSRAYLPGMIEKGWGRVVFIASESALNIPSDMIHYGFSKTAQLSIARGLSKRVAGTGVTVNSVLPGPTLSDGLVEMLKDATKPSQSIEEAAAEFVMANRPSSIIQRAASVTEVANMVVYVCSTLSSATSGAALRVDGGVVDSLV
ncbi:SDR family NAD(P)-dependent oxidoreductase [Imhoffiella purpurea]|uniref:3-oxoacyl-[acyl-carrier protein] reductase n=1 Tax=Imhoffiella purpurea TaxID=1249627 RepID=W9VVQ3_9GAMM|nr:SDR family oxidoreductase [Imhoffiella purpurea]EXJ14515.1 3-oxoacyl-[acyl-carrier protein] reductase [Imhoffiella purpurea]